MHAHVGMKYCGLAVFILVSQIPFLLQQNEIDPMFYTEWLLSIQ
jgi:hypothetical protein